MIICSRSTSRDGKASVSSSTVNQPPSTTNTNTGTWKQYTEEVDPFDKLRNDLFVVMEKNKLCREILQVSPGIQQDEALADMIGYLEACRDRMIDIIEAGTQGLLGEELFNFALKVNDAIIKTLDAERVSDRYR